MIYILLGILGLYRMHRRIDHARRAWRVLDREPLHFHVAACRLLLYGGAALIAFGKLLPYVGAAGWCSCGLALVGGMWIPCAVGAVNRIRALFILRNVIFALIGLSFIAHGIGLR